MLNNKLQTYGNMSDKITPDEIKEKREKYFSQTEDERTKSFTNNKSEKIENECYICGVNLNEMYKNETTKQNDLSEQPQKFPEMILWNGKVKEVCGPCYKSVESGLKTYEENHPGWKRPTAKKTKKKD